MIRLLLILLLFAFALSMAFASIGQSQAQGRIRVEATLVDVRIHDGHSVQVFFLWNRKIRSRPLGHAFLSCWRIGEGGLLGSGVSICQGSYVLPRGKITVAGPLHRYRRYTLVITGGSGLYTGVNGILTGERAEPGTFDLVFRLT